MHLSSYGGLVVLAVFLLSCGSGKRNTMGAVASTVESLVDLVVASAIVAVVLYVLRLIMPLLQDCCWRRRQCSRHEPSVRYHPNRRSTGSLEQLQPSVSNQYPKITYNVYVVGERAVPQLSGDLQKVIALPDKTSFERSLDIAATSKE